MALMVWEKYKVAKKDIKEAMSEARAREFMGYNNP